ncbi:hypothetical protein HKD42_09905 [Altererythrobacter sp. RZ02]|uniref:Uncharacterized protein n=1 Tax=Pontixanthobacter rizhaonensis TaxID=2730337 RepID=A0A848QMJ4_9SPHN|nr:hypothetical protein [Pontixanthobacter rizhaonensis]NMW32374.1 hypothetical protein [Pontixanthobacter rizhaonensis]
MSGFQSRFDEAAAEARRLFIRQGPTIREVIPGFWHQDFYRLLTGISELLKKVDQRNVQHPEYLAHTSGHIGEYAVSLAKDVPSAIEAGGDNFVKTTLSGLIACESRLSKAVGKHYHKVREVKDQYVRELQRLSVDAQSYEQISQNAAASAESFQENAKNAEASTNVASESAKEAAEKIKKVRVLVEKLASGDARGKSLESLKRRAEAKLDQIDDVLTKSATAKALVEQSNLTLNKTKLEIDALLGRLKDVENRAQDVLSLSNQAGLAASYLKESAGLKAKSYVFTGILYVTAIAAVFIAAFYVLPSLERTAADGNGAILDSRAIYITLLRATVLAPLVYVIYFTTKQISALETLRMDYAEKAAASLAYSGYKDELSVDDSLLEQLRGSLLLRFAEHPERLLRKTPFREAIKIRLPGFLASSTSGPSKDQNKSDGIDS